MARATRGSDQFQLRLPDGMREQIKQSADANGRSMNAEIIYRLEHGVCASDDKDLVSLLRAALAKAEQRGGANG